MKFKALLGVRRCRPCNTYRPKKSSHINIPPLFVDMLVDAITQSMLRDGADAYEARVREILFGTHRISTQNSQVLCGDQFTLDMLNNIGGLGDIGRFLPEHQGTAGRCKHAGADR